MCKEPVRQIILLL